MSSEETNTENTTIDAHIDPQIDDKNTPEKPQRPTDPEALNAIIDQVEAERDDLAGKLEKIMRAYADAENRMKRADKDKVDAIKYGPSKMARDLLEVADNFDRALKAFPEDQDDTLKEIFEGLNLTQKSLHQVFGRYDITKIETQGAVFDPNIHEAVTQIPVPDQESGTIVDVIRNGYKISDRLLRPAQVVTVA